MPVTSHGAGEIAWHKWEQHVVSVCGVVPVVAIVPVFPSTVLITAL